MANNSKRRLGERVLGIFLALSIAAFFYAPALAPRAQAFLGIVDVSVTTDVAALAKRIINAAAQILARKMIEQTVNSTITWANTGFEGNPAYVTNPQRFYGKVAEKVVTDEIVNDSNLGFVCSPFQAQIKLSLVSQYVKPFQAQCTFNQIGRNLDDFYKSFNKGGGWKAWFDMTQQDANNPYGAYLGVKTNIDSRLANELSIAQEDRKIDSGYLSYKPCKTKNPDVGDDLQKLQDGYLSRAEFNQLHPDFDFTAGSGECVKYGDVTTPGSVIADNVNSVLHVGSDKLVNAQEVDQLVGALLNGLLKRYVFGPKGLFSDNYADHLNQTDEPPQLKAPTYGWIFCANEGEMCSFDGEEKVRYGINGFFKELTVSDGVMCTSEFFGLVSAPIGLGNGQKTCQYYGQVGGTFDKTTNSVNWASCASEGGTCTVAGTKQVRFGVSDSYNIAVADGHIACTSAAFSGDPAPGEAKACESRGSATPTTTNHTATSLSCKPSVSTAQQYLQTVVWSLSGPYSATTTYGWYGDDFAAPGSTLTPSVATTLEVRYHSVGIKHAGVKAFDEAGNAIGAADCSSTVSITQ